MCGQRRIPVRKWLKSISVSLLVCLLAVSAGSQAVRVSQPQGTLRPLNILSEPGATVWINGVKYGKTDESGKLSIATIPTGSQTIRVRADGFKEISRILTPTQKGDISIPLAKTSDPAELAYQQAEVLALADREAAAEAYKKAIKLRPQYLEAHIGLARLYAEAGDYEQAESAIRSARRVRPALAEISAIEGRVYKDVGDEQKAIASFKRAIKEGNGFQPEAYTGLGILSKDRAETAGAAADYAQETANFNEAAKHLTIAAKQLGGAPDAMVVLQLLGLVYERQKKYKEAIGIYEEFLRIFPDSSEAVAVESFIVQIKKQMTQKE